MPTINSKEAVDDLVAANGHFMDDTPVVKIVEYTNIAGDTAYGLIYEGHSLDTYRETEFVRSPKVYWEKVG